MAEKLLIKKDRTFFVKDDTKDVHTQFGFIKASDLKNPPGTIVKTNKDVEMILIEPDFLDKIKKIKRGAQVIPLKDIGTIIAETGINKNSNVVDAGAGSGYMALFLAIYSKQVTTYEIRDDHFDIVKHNIDFMELKNIKLKKGNIYESIDEKNVDVINLDVPEPWLAIPTIQQSLKVGGYIVSYSPTIPQVMDFCNEIKKFEEFLHLKTIEIIEREWDVFGRKVRPKTQTIGHSGFLTFVRKIR